MTHRQSLFGWALYDFANTIFSAIVLTFYFPLYLTDLTGRNLELGLATTTAMIFAGLTVPWLGGVSDRTGKTKGYLAATTLACVFFTSTLSFFTQVSFLFAAFFFACFFFHASLVFYSALLPVVAEPKRQGFASGLGTALGYLGVLFSVPIAQAVSNFWGRRFVFITAGVLFLVFSIPLFQWVPERKVSNPAHPTWKLLGEEWRKVGKTAVSIFKEKPLLFFFLGNFFLVDAVNTAIFWLVVYMQRVFHPAPNQLVFIYLSLNFSAFLFGFLAGWLTDRWSADKVLLMSAFALFFTFLALGMSGGFWLSDG